jgi:hypothetical protein
MSTSTGCHPYTELRKEHQSREYYFNWPTSSSYDYQTVTVNTYILIHSHFIFLTLLSIQVITRLKKKAFIHFQSIFPHADGDEQTLAEVLFPQIFQLCEKFPFHFIEYSSEVWVSRSQFPWIDSYMRFHISEFPNPLPRTYWQDSF